MNRGKRQKTCAKGILLKWYGPKKASLVKTFKLEKIEDLRVHAEMFPTKPENVYKACLAGIRR